MSGSKSASEDDMRRFALKRSYRGPDTACKPLEGLVRYDQISSRSIVAVITSTSCNENWVPCARTVPLTSTIALPS